MAGTGQGGRFSLSGRYCGVEQGTYYNPILAVEALKEDDNGAPALPGVNKGI